MPLNFSRSAAAATMAPAFAAILVAASGEGCQIIAGPDWSRIYLAEGGAGGQGGRGGAGGQGGAACEAASDCPGVDAECSARACEGGQCVALLTPAGTKVAQQTAGDCLAVVCDGVGGVALAPDDADILNDQLACTDDLCSAGAPVNAHSAAGSPCGRGGDMLCNGLGDCVECLAQSDCASGVCQGSACVPATCADGVINGAETDTDCGGGACNPCGDREACAAGSDCASGVCAGSECQAATCGDSLKNGGETGADCGGPSCAPCGPGQGCAGDSDCIGGACSGSVCLPTCSDNVKNPGETGVDCGGLTCAPCADGGGCAESADCASGVCVGGVCQAPTCIDGVKNGTEVGLDCGGGSCPACPPGEPCAGGTDCASGVCQTGLCAEPVCGDGVVNGDDACDDGNDDNSDACLFTCEIAVCGDSYIHDGVEVCDDGDDDNTDECALCQPAICGDGYVHAGVEACDDGNDENTDACVSGCAIAICGDGYPHAGVEACDDGGAGNGDGCDSGCAGESLLTEAEPNNTAADADARAEDASPILMNGASTAIKGAISPFMDADIFKMTLASSALVRIETFDGTGAGCGGGITTKARLLEGAGLELMADPATLPPPNGPSGIGGCSALVVNLPPGPYYVRVEEAGGDASIPAYMLQVKIHEDKGFEAEPNDTPAQASLIAGSDVFVFGAHAQNDDADYFAIQIPAGRSIRAEVIEGGGETCESGGMDSLLTLIAPELTELASDDDEGRGACSLIDGTGGADARDPSAGGLPGGLYTIRVQASPSAQAGPNGQFDYRLAITVR